MMLLALGKHEPGASTLKCTLSRYIFPILSQNIFPRPKTGKKAFKDNKYRYITYTNFIKRKKQW
jgi:2',3'-cyclic-nucleotide 2'-phosphodiesterase (5'-nucleotidase family)